MLSNKRGKSVTAKFIAVGLTAFIVNYIALEFFIQILSVDKVMSAVFAMVITIHLTFALHTKWTYKKDDTDYYISLPKRYLSYLATNSTGSIITIVGFALLSSSLPNIIALGISAGVAMVWNFLMNLIVWRHGKKYTEDIVATLK